MDTEIKKSISAADMYAQYDEKAKRLLGNKIILAHILVKTVDEFREMKPEDVVPYIEGEPFISAVPVEPGQTNGITDLNTYGQCQIWLQKPPFLQHGTIITL